MADAPPPRAKVDPNLIDRFEKIFSEFQHLYGKKPLCYVRVPGRINLIGEHIDYCGYAVLPMAIEQDVVIAVGVNKASCDIVMNNTNTTFVPYSCAVDQVEIDAHCPQWYHYVLCGYRGVIEHSRHLKSSDHIGLELLIDSNLPMSAGLSSSSALVCAAALATMQAYKLHLSKRELAEICQHCERYIGTEGGGMDQAIAFLADAGTAKLVEFDPVRTQDVFLPDNAAFVVSNSCVEKHKATTNEFNTRVAECRLACQILAQSKGLNWRVFQRLGDLHRKLGATFEEMIDLVKKTLHSESYSKVEISGILGITIDELDKICLSEKSRQVEKFELQKRALHVFSEANRVWQFKTICDDKKSDAIQKLGQLMNESHASCRDLYECSCSQLDQLVSLASEYGALGSRLTGAGWGGCSISLVEANKVDDFLVKLADGYYKQNDYLAQHLPNALFATLPGYGATVYD